MSDYLEQLGSDATISDAFYDLHGQVDELVAGLNVLSVAEYGEGSNQKSIPDTDLEMNWSHGFGGGEGHTMTTYVGTYANWDRQSLLSISTTTPAASKDRNPSGLAAWRGTEIGGDYTLQVFAPNIT